MPANPRLKCETWAWGWLLYVLAWRVRLWVEVFHWMGFAGRVRLRVEVFDGAARRVRLGVEVFGGCVLVMLVVLVVFHAGLSCCGFGLTVDWSGGARTSVDAVKIDAALHAGKHARQRWIGCIGWQGGCQGKTLSPGGALGLLKGWLRKLLRTYAPTLRRR